MSTHGIHGQTWNPWVAVEFVGTPGVHDESMIVGAGWGGFGKRGEVHGGRRVVEKLELMFARLLAVH